MAERTAAQKEAEVDLGKREMTPAEKKKREQSHEDAPPTPEATPAIGSVNAAYTDPPGNWSDPEELAEKEAEYEGSMAKPPEEEAKEERKKIRDEERERVAKAIEDNQKKSEDRAEWEIEERKKREGKAA
jgi:hypothetical protein